MPREGPLRLGCNTPQNALPIKASLIPNNTDNGIACHYAPSLGVTRILLRCQESEIYVWSLPKACPRTLLAQSPAAIPEPLLHLYGGDGCKLVKFPCMTVLTAKHSVPSPDG